MRVALDAMGGDFAPLETVKGAILAIKEVSHLNVILVGDEDLIAKELKKYSYNKEQIKIKHADEVISMDEKDNPALAVRKKPNASLNVAIDLVKGGEADAIVSAGNTGALMTASQLKLRRIKGVLRPAITALLPSERGHIVILDVGANAQCKPEYLNQFAIMASKYTEVLLNKTNPRVGLLNIGEEDSKGNDFTKESFEHLKENKKINFIGNIEGRDIFHADVDIVVTDGFTGNIVLKTAEGIAAFIMRIIKEEVGEKLRYKIAGLLLKPMFKKMKKRIDSSEYGGAILLGLNGISIKAHGNSDSNAFKNAIQVAEKFAEANLVAEIEKIVN